MSACRRSAGRLFQSLGPAAAKHACVSVCVVYLPCVHGFGRMSRRSQAREAGRLSTWQKAERASPTDGAFALTTDLLFTLAHFIFP